MNSLILFLMRFYKGSGLSYKCWNVPLFELSFCQRQNLWWLDICMLDMPQSVMLARVPNAAVSTLIFGYEVHWALIHSPMLPGVTLFVAANRDRSLQSKTFFRGWGKLEEKISRVLFRVFANLILGRPELSSNLASILWKTQELVFTSLYLQVL